MADHYAVGWPNLGQQWLHVTSQREQTGPLTRNMRLQQSQPLRNRQIRHWGHLTGFLAKGQSCTLRYALIHIASLSCSCPWLPNTTTIPLLLSLGLPAQIAIHHSTRYLNQAHLCHFNHELARIIWFQLVSQSPPSCLLSAFCVSLVCLMLNSCLPFATEALNPAIIKSNIQANPAATADAAYLDAKDAVALPIAQPQQP